MNRHALVSGSFDPPTLGHIDVIQRAAKLFDEVTVCVFRNAEKTYLFSEEERLSMLSLALCEAGLDSVKVDVYDGYVATYTKERGISYVVRGVRDETDMAYEANMASVNKQLNPELETVILVAHEEQKGISSTKVRSSLQNGVIPDALLPKSVVEKIRTILGVGKSST